MSADVINFSHELTTPWLCGTDSNMAILYVPMTLQILNAFILISGVSADQPFVAGLRYIARARAKDDDGR